MACAPHNPLNTPSICRVGTDGFVPPAYSPTPTPPAHHPSAFPPRKTRAPHLSSPGPRLVAPRKRYSLRFCPLLPAKLAASNSINSPIWPKPFASIASRWSLRCPGHRLVAETLSIWPLSIPTHCAIIAMVGGPLANWHLARRQELLSSIAPLVGQC